MIKYIEFKAFYHGPIYPLFSLVITCLFQRLFFKYYLFILVAVVYRIFEAVFLFKYLNFLRRGGVWPLYPPRVNRYILFGFGVKKYINEKHYHMLII